MVLAVRRQPPAQPQCEPQDRQCSGQQQQPNAADQDPGGTRTQGIDVAGRVGGEHGGRPAADIA